MYVGKMTIEKGVNCYNFCQYRFPVTNFFFLVVGGERER